MLIVLAGAALLLSELSLPTGVAVLAVAVLVAWREWRQPTPRLLRWQSDGTVWLDWADGSERVVTPLADRAVGLLTVLVLCDQDSVRRLVVWPDMLLTDDRKALRRRLKSGLSSSDSG